MKLVRLGLVLLISAFVISVASGQGAQEALRSDEYYAVAAVYNDELSALGERALYPICVVPPAGTRTDSLVHYLLRHGFTASDPKVCNPSPGSGDFPHGMEIRIQELRRDPGGEIDMQVAVGDNTIHYGVHVAMILRQGTYHLRKDENGSWQIVRYTKDYDIRDKEPEHNR